MEYNEWFLNMVASCADLEVHYRIKNIPDYIGRLYLHKKIDYQTFIEIIEIDPMQMAKSIIDNMDHLSPLILYIMISYVCINKINSYYFYRLFTWLNENRFYFDGLCGQNFSDYDLDYKKFNLIEELSDYFPVNQLPEMIVDYSDSNLYLDYEICKILRINAPSYETYNITLSDIKKFKVFALKYSVGLTRKLKHNNIFYYYEININTITSAGFNGLIFE
jgi:hypothetical protein